MPPLKKREIKRAVKEGGVLLIGCGAPEGALADAIDAQLKAHPNVTLTVLILPTQKAESTDADEVWVLARYGFQGMLALIRRISWRRFDLVCQPWISGKGAVPWLKFFILPRPAWHYDKISASHQVTSH